ncbi:hypothetical protein BBP40_004115 [Aspergillus hancockii]|nr:hypothetical protein BBP40_004115 [Aspergillus hancockii]
MTNQQPGFAIPDDDADGDLLYNTAPKPGSSTRQDFASRGLLVKELKLGVAYLAILNVAVLSQKLVA